MNRIDEAFERCRNEERKALVAFVTAGDPNLQTTQALVPRLAEAGADIVELGVPFSDPMADGPTIQEASQRALAAGTTLTQILDIVRRARQTTDVPIVLFSYYNVLLQYGIDRLAADSRDAGVDGWLVVDVPHEEAGEVRPHLDRHRLHWITLVAPTTTTDRAAALTATARGFVYCITVTGVTGARSELPPDLSQYLAGVRQHSEVPVVAGFGISSPDMARTVAREADGIVVGSALVRALRAGPTPDEGVASVCELVSALADALKE